MNLAQRLTQLDVWLLYWTVLQRQYRPVMVFARCASRSGDGYLQVLFIVWFATRPNTSGQTIAIWLIGVFAAERCVYFLLKNSLKRQRPPAALPSFEAVIQASDKFSFPSGHTSAAFVAVSVCGLLDLTLFWVALTWAMSVGASRVILGVHYPSDTLASASLGTGIVYLGIPFASHLAIL